VGGKPKVIYLLEEESVPTREDALSILNLHNSFCDNLLRLLENPMNDERVRRKVLAHGIRHLKGIGISVTRHLRA